MDNRRKCIALLFAAALLCSTAIHSRAADFELNLSAGWSLISAPLTGTGAPATALGGFYYEIYGWDTTNGKFENLSGETSLVPGKGYWVYVEEDQTSTVSGTTLSGAQEVELLTGWNAIGNPLNSTLALTMLTVDDEPLAESAKIAGVVYYWDGAEYQEASDFQAGVGYWVKAKEACTLTVPASVELYAPTNIGADGMDLAWEEADAAGFGDYRLYRATAPGVTEASTLVATIADRTETSRSVTGLSPAVTYYFKVFVCPDGVSTGCMGSNEVSATTAPEGVALNTPTNPTESSLDLEWAAAPGQGFGSYKLYYSTSTGVTQDSTLAETVTDHSTTNTTVDDLSQGTVYYFKLYVCDAASPPACAGSNEVSGSTRQQAVTLDVPSNPTPTSLDLSWTQSQAGNFGSYKIYRAVTPGVTQSSTLAAAIADAATTSTVISSLSAGNTYYFRVFVCDDGSPEYCVGSNEVSGATAPNAITLQSITNGTNVSLDLSWTQSHAPTFGSYKVYKDTAPGVDQTASKIADIEERTTTSTTATGLDPGLSYYFRVFVCTDADPAVCTGSNEVSGATGVTLSSPTNAQAATLDVAWTEFAGDQFGSYKLYRKTSAGVTQADTLAATVTSAQTTTAQATGLDSGSRYYFKVFVCDGGSPEYCAPSNEVSGHTMPTAVTVDNPADGTDSSFQLSWSQNLDPTFLYYDIYYATSPGVTMDSTSGGAVEDQFTLSTAVTSLSAATTYYFKVYSCDSSIPELCAASNNEVSGTTGVTLQAPTNAQSATLDLAWGQSPDPDFDNYKLYYSTSPGVSQGSLLAVTVSDVEETTHQMSGLLSGRTYYFRVYSCDDGAPAVCAGSNEVSGNTLLSPATLNPPFNPSEGTLDLSWSQNLEPAFHAYMLYRSTSPEVSQSHTLAAEITDSATLTTTAPGLEPGTTYYFRLFTCDEHALCSDSNEVSAPTNPSSVTLDELSDVTSSTMTLDWSASDNPNLQSYKIYRSLAAGVTQASTLIETISPATSTTAVADGLNSATQYFFRVFSCDNSDPEVCAGSNEVSQYSGVNLDPPAGVDQETLTLSWQQTPDPSFHAYRVYRSEAPGVTQDSDLIAAQSPNTATSFNMTDGTAGSTYYFKVFACHGDEPDDFCSESNEVVATMDIELDEPTRITNSGMTIDWTQTTFPDFASYKVYIATHSGVNQSSDEVATVESISQTTLTTADLASNTLFYYRAYVCDTEAPPNCTGSNVTRAPTSVTLSEPNPDNVTQTSIPLSWQQTLSYGSLGDMPSITFDRYEIYMDQASWQPFDATPSTLVATIDTVGTTNYTVTELDTGETYYFRVYVRNQEQPEAFTSSNEIMTSAAITLSATSDVTSQTVALTWNPTTDPEFSSYKLYIGTSPGLTQSSSEITTITNKAQTNTTAAGLASNTRFYFKAYVCDLAVPPECTPSNEVSVYTGLTLASPASDQTSIDLTWSQSLDPIFAGYELYRSTTSTVNRSSTLIDTYPNIATTSASSTGLSPGTRYYHRLYVCDGATPDTYCTASNTLGTNTYAEPVTLDSVDNPATETLRVNWQPSDAQTFASYRIYRATVAGVSQASTLVETLTTRTTGAYVNQYLNPGTTYYYRVYVCDSYGACTGSNEERGTTAVLLEGPFGVTTTSFSLSWTQTNDPDYYRYRIYRSDTSGVTVEDELMAEHVGISNVTHNASGLTPGTAYYYKVFVCHDDTPESCYDSNELAASTLLDAVTLEDPLSATSDSITLQWSTTDAGNFQSYKLYMDLAPGVNELSELAATFSSSDASTDTIANLTPGLTYYFRIYVCDALVCNASNEVSAGTGVALLEAPDSTQNTVTLEWSASGIANFQSYRIYYSNDPGVTMDDTLGGVVFASGATSDTVGMLTAGRTYYFKVFTCDSGGFCAASNEVDTNTYPTPVTITSGPSNPTATSLYITWSQSAAETFASYRVYWNIVSGVDEYDYLSVTESDIEALSATVDGLDPGSPIYMVVMVCDAQSRCAGSNEVNARTRPSAVELFDPYNELADRLELAWTDPVMDSSIFGQYRIYRSTEPGVTESSTLAATVNNIALTADNQVTGLSAGTYYYLRVYVCDNMGLCGEGSNEVLGSSLLPNEWITIPAGIFLQGCATATGDLDCIHYEYPKHEVQMSVYDIHKYPVSNRQYAICANAGFCAHLCADPETCPNPELLDSLTVEGYHTTSAYTNYPVINLTWAQAGAYCAYVGGDLPTEAQWEKAARGPKGSDLHPYPERKYPWGNDTPTCSWANFTGCTGDTIGIASLPANSSYYSVMDMAGNVTEWVRDWFGTGYYDACDNANCTDPSCDVNNRCVNPTGPASGTGRVIRGGSFIDLIRRLRVSSRFGANPTERNYNYGFRCAR